ncbi:MAG: glycosyltransferase family 4 protein [Chloroflexota bacterium]
MRIVFVGPFGLSPKRTMAARALPLAQALTRRGHTVVMLLPPWSNPVAAGTSSDECGVRVVNLPLPPRIPVLFHFWLTLALLHRALALQPDVIHCFKPKAYAGLVAWCIWQLKRLGVTRTRLVVDADDWEGAGGWNDVERYTWPLKKFFAWQERWGLTHADAITVASRALQTIVWSLGVPRTRVLCVPNGVSVPDHATTRPRDHPTTRPSLLLYTRFFEFDLSRVARLFARIGAQHPSLRFVVLGTGFFGEEQQFAQLLDASGMRERVTWLSWPPPDGLAATFARATLAVYPFDDTLLNRTKCAVKLTELLNAGVPVVAEAVGQNAEYIAHGESGLLVRAGDADAFVAAVTQLLNDDDLRARIGDGARRRMADHFAWDKLVREVERAYGA